MRNHVSRLKQFGGLWRHPDFLKLWAGQTVSLGGSLVSRVALPFVAILTLDASPGEVVLLRMADLVPGIVIGLFAGVWADRLRRRPLMIWADLGRAVWSWCWSGRSSLPMAPPPSTRSTRRA
jgi:Transmembrane secretion effector